MELIAILLAIFSILFAAIWFSTQKFKSYVISLGLPVHKNVVWRYHKTDFRKRDVESMKKYGKLWVDYTATIPFVNVAEPEIIKEIMVKYFDKFVNRQEIGVEEQHMSLIDAR